MSAPADMRLSELLDLANGLGRYLETHGPCWPRVAATYLVRHVLDEAKAKERAAEERERREKT